MKEDSLRAGSWEFSDPGWLLPLCLIIAGSMFSGVGIAALAALLGYALTEDMVSLALFAAGLLGFLVAVGGFFWILSLRGRGAAVPSTARGAGQPYVDWYRSTKASADAAGGLSDADWAEISRRVKMMEMYKASEVAELFGVTTETVFRWAKRNELAAVLIRGVCWIDPVSVEKLAREGRKEARGAA